MAWNEVTGPCNRCGRTITRKVRSRKDLHCADCGMEAARRAAIEMSRKSGPAWDNFIRSRGASGRPPKHQRK